MSSQDLEAHVCHPSIPAVTWEGTQASLDAGRAAGMSGGQEQETLFQRRWKVRATLEAVP